MIFAPSRLISELFFPVADRYGDVITLIDFAVDSGFYKTIETGQFLDPFQFHHLRNAVEGHRLQLTQWATFIINNEKLSPANLEPVQRRHSQQRLLPFPPIQVPVRWRSGGDPGIYSREKTK